MKLKKITDKYKSIYAAARELGIKNPEQLARWLRYESREDTEIDVNEAGEVFLTRKLGDISLSRTIEITDCTISRAWYEKHIGEQFKIDHEAVDGYFVVAPDGYINIVKKSDAKLI